MNRNSFINEYVSLNRKFEVKFFPVVKKAIHKKVQATIARLREGGYHSATNYLHTDLHNPAMTEAITQLYKIVGLKHAQVNYSRLLHDSRKRKWIDLHLQTKGFGFNSKWIDFILNYLKRHLVDKVTIQINATTRDALLRALSIMQFEGLSVDGAILKLEEWPYEEFQAARIVRTEVNRAANTGAMAQADTSNWQQLKEWIAIHDNRTRGNPLTGAKDHANHWSLDGVKIDEGDVFVDPRNGDRLEFPGDPKASAESTINCRCSVAYTFKRDRNGNLIPKRKSTVVLYPNQTSRPQIVTI